ncbi:MAG: hypothetical protein EBR67_00805 [Proteobacteria bacterium]|nr:hypothetical protein [Pseudomonadota bacterium]
MKAYLSYSYNGYNRTPDEAVVNLHKLCFFYLKKQFKEVYLITDDLSKDFFKDIPWTDIYVELNNISEAYYNVWSLSKINAYKIIAQKGDPFIHVDSDVVLWKPLPDRILHSEVFVQSPEDIKNHGYEIENFIQHCPYKSFFEFIKYPTIGYNMGIFGGNNLSFILDYATNAYNFVLKDENKDFWLNFNGYKNSWAKAVLAEQYFLSAFSVYKNQLIEPLFEQWPSEEMAISAGYSHLMLAKNDLNIKIRIEDLVKNLDLGVYKP